MTDQPRAKFSVGEEVYVVSIAGYMGGGIVLSCSWGENQFYTSAITGESGVHTGYIYKISGIDPMCHEIALKRKQQTSGSWDELMNEFSGPISKKILTN